MQENSNSILLAGPCSAESYEQVWLTAKTLKELAPHAIFRAGIWKPRTKPGGFEGVGALGLSWLAHIQKTLQLPVAIEVASSAHVQEALAHGIHIFWIGARTSVNPFYVQEIANAVQGLKQVSVWVKNPLHADLALWQGAIERFQKANIGAVGAIHRGFFPLGETVFRNDPHWSVPIALKRRQPQLPLICDISHIAGTRERLLPLAQEALDLNFDGWMVEVHHHPEAAWTDAQQQITPNALAHILSTLKVRGEQSPSYSPNEGLQRFRQAIDACDSKIIDAISQRMALVAQIATYKKQHDLKILQNERWQSVLAHYLETIPEQNLSQEFTLRLTEAIHEEAIRIQHEIMNC